MKQAGTVALALFLSILVTHYLHELGHALMAASLGYDVLVTANLVRPLTGPYDSELHNNLIAIAGPAVTILLATTAFAARHRLGFLAPIILWNTLTMRLLAAAVSFSHPNDEAKVSASLDLGTWTLPILVCGFLLVLFVVAARERQLRAWWYFGAWIGMSAGYSLVVLGERWLPQFVL